MKLQQTVKSIAQVKVNFMKSEDKIAELGSKAYYRYYRDGSVGIVGELTDGFMLSMNTTDAGTVNMTDHLKGLTVNLRLTAEQFEVINGRFHEMNALGAYVEIELDGNVEHGTLTVRNEEVESFTIYVAAVNEVEPMAALRVGSVTSNSNLMQLIAKQKVAQAEKSAAVIATNRAAREGAPVVATAEMFK